MKHVNIQIYGKVQGVFYRQSAQQKAEELNVVGWAKNQKDGSVYIEAEGEEEQLKKMIKWCRQGSQTASVTSIDYEFSDKIVGYLDFSIRF